MMKIYVCLGEKHYIQGIDVKYDDLRLVVMTMMMMMMMMTMIMMMMDVIVMMMVSTVRCGW